MPFDWRQFHRSNTARTAVVDPRRRLAICLAGFVAAALLIIARAIQLEATQGEQFRAEATRPVTRSRVVPAPRGRIVTADGTVLACDRSVQALAIDYRWLKNPPDPAWVRSVARARLSKADRKIPARVAAERDSVLADRAALHRQLAALCNISLPQWNARRERIQQRVEKIVASVHGRRDAEAAETDYAEQSWSARLRHLLLDDPDGPRDPVREELDYHVVAEDVPSTAVAEIEGNPRKYLGAKIVRLIRRDYPRNTLAAHVVGYVGALDDDTTAGRAGIERWYEEALSAHPGIAVDQLDRRGAPVVSYERHSPRPGGEIVLHLNAALQSTAEELLRDALRRQAIVGNAEQPAGGAIVVMDVHDGRILAAASAPTFDPNIFTRDDLSSARAAILSDRSHPLFNRVGSMAIPPGSTFKVLTALALLESETVSPATPFHCQGYLHQPDRQRCELFINQGVGHGDIRLLEALTMSCNVYFFHFAERLGPQRLTEWAARAGFGRASGIDLPGEVSGNLPQPNQNIQQRPWRVADAQAIAIGQGTLTVTPLQMLRFLAAVANGGKLPRPQIVKSVAGQLALGQGAPERLNVRPQTLDALQQALRQVVADPDGTAHATVFDPAVAIAGKTGTAQTGGDRPSHAWFAGYASVQEPRLAFVIVLEHAGDAAASAGPVARRLVLRMQQLGLL